MIISFPDHCALAALDTTMSCDALHILAPAAVHKTGLPLCARVNPIIGRLSPCRISRCSQIGIQPRTIFGAARPEPAPNLKGSHEERDAYQRTSA